MPSLFPRIPRFLLPIACLLAGLGAQTVHELQQFHPGQRSYFGLEFDAARGEVVAFGGASLPQASMLGWNGVRWADYRLANTGPLPRPYVATTRDPLSGRIYLYGGTVSNAISTELWQWDGAAWSLLSTGGPPPRSYTALAFDPATQSLYLFGGVRNNFPQGDLWRWNGTWTAIPNGGVAPPARHNHTMVWDPGLGTTGGLLVFGGDSYYTGWLGDTWLWTPQAGWVQAAGTSPGPQYDHAMCRDEARNRVVLFGYDYAARVSKTWEWNGTSWQQQLPATVPEYRRQARLAYDPLRQRVVLYGGGEWPYPQSIFSVWEWNGIDWRVASTELGGRSTVVTAYDEGRRTQVLFATRYTGPLDPFVSTTWEWNGAGLQERQLVGPSARGLPSLWYDPVAQRTMLYGGQGLFTTSLMNDTWSYDGASWVQLAPPNQPPPRVAPSLAYDPVRRRAVLFGGFDTADRQDTWEWDGSTWTQRTPLQNPGLRSSAGLGFDPVGQRLILFGGDRNATLTSLDDTWAWDGSNWQQLQPAVHPTGRRGAKLVHDRDRNRLVLFGGSSLNTAIWELEIWEWSGSMWVTRGQVPVSASATGGTYDTHRGRVQLVAGSGLRVEFAVPSASVGPGNAATDPVLGCQGRPEVGGTLQLVATTSQAGPMFVLVAFGVPTPPAAIVGPFCQPTATYLPGPAFAFPMVAGSVALAIPAQPYVSLLAMTAQAVQLRGACVDASNALAIRLQPQ